MSKRWIGFLSVATIAAGGLVGCGDDGDADDGPELTGKECETVDDCYPDLDTSQLSGEVQCLDRVQDGYCTHLCQTDDDCCAVDGECEADLNHVCSPFESTGQLVCFISCEPEDLTPPPDANPDDPVDEQEFCQRVASPAFICRSSGGGSINRKVCVPADCGVGAACAGDEDCDPDLTCATGYDGGYCTQTGCTLDADCPVGSVCVTDGDTNVCLRTCTAETDCSLCRDAEVATACTDQVDFVEATGVTVCAP